MKALSALLLLFVLQETLCLQKANTLQSTQALLQNLDDEYNNFKQTVFDKIKESKEELDKNLVKLVNETTKEAYTASMKILLNVLEKAFKASKETLRICRTVEDPVANLTLKLTGIVNVSTTVENSIAWSSMLLVKEKILNDNTTKELKLDLNNCDGGDNACFDDIADKAESFRKQLKERVGALVKHFELLVQTANHNSIASKYITLKTGTKLAEHVGDVMIKCLESFNPEAVAFYSEDIAYLA